MSISWETPSYNFGLDLKVAGSSKPDLPPSIRYTCLRTTRELQYSPNSGHAHAEIKTVLRNQIKLYRNAPHGYYIGQDAPGNQYLFSFVSGNDIVKAFHDALVAQTAPKSPKITMSSTAVFNPVLMKTGQQSNNTNSNYHAFKINIRSSVSFQGCKAFYYLRANVDDTTPGPRGLEFELPIDTGSKHSQIPPNTIIEDWPVKMKQNTDTIKWPFTVQGPDLHKVASRIIQYGSDGYVRMHDAPLKSNVVVTLHGWDWEKKDHSLKGFKIHDGVDFVSAANECILWDGYDGNIGLGPRQGDIQTEKSRVCPLFPLMMNPVCSKDLQSFLASLTATRQILDALVNPDAYFSSPIPTISRDIADMGRPERWTFKLLRIGICSVDRNDYSWINMDSPEKRSSIIQGIDILMDTATPMTVLPDYVVSKIQSDENWLGSSRQTRLDLSMNDKMYTRLARKKIQFEFKGSYDQKEFVLGQNWYWAAIVKHVSPREKQKYPFVQVMPNGYFTSYDTNKTVSYCSSVRKNVKLYHPVFLVYATQEELSIMEMELLTIQYL
ncbi:hypothetical protein EV359DRAFT_67146 [Lentinula novae-zelandiae]|nr:hypothetical protein EV359DRAFT_67146 [Lentinula novae-zelandiae]